MDLGNLVPLSKFKFFCFYLIILIRQMLYVSNNLQIHYARKRTVTLKKLAEVTEHLMKVRYDCHNNFE